MFRNVGLFIQVPVGIFLFAESELELSVSGVSGSCLRHIAANKKKEPVARLPFWLRLICFRK